MNKLLILLLTIPCSLRSQDVRKDPKIVHGRALPQALKRRWSGGTETRKTGGVVHLHRQRRLSGQVEGRWTVSRVNWFLVAVLLGATSAAAVVYAVTR